MNIDEVAVAAGLAAVHDIWKETRRRHGDARNPRVRVVALPAGRVLANTAVGERARALDPVPLVWQRLRPNKRLKLTARVDYGVTLFSSARRSLSAIR